MILAHSPQPDKPDSIVNLPHDLDAYVRLAAQKGTIFDDLEWTVIQRVLILGKTVNNLFLNAQGHGDLGPMVRTSDGTILQRSEEPHACSIRTIFGSHYFHAFV